MTGFNPELTVSCSIYPLQMFLQSVLVGTHLGKEFQGQGWQLYGEIHSEAVAPQKAMVICQLLHFPARSWSALFQHSWLSPFLLPLCKWPARSLSWKEFRMGSGKHQGWHKGANKDKWEAASITPLKPWHASNTNACKYTGGWTRCPPEGPFTSTILWCFSEYKKHKLPQKLQDHTKYV